MIVCCYHTGGAYKREADRLAGSLDRWGMDYRIDEVASRGSWDRNILIAAEYIRDVLRDAVEPILYVDADAEFHAEPEFDTGYDIQAHYLRARELLGGTLWFNATDAARSVVDEWCSEVRVGEWEQKTLQRIVERRKDIRFNRIGPEYCFIYDTSRALHPGVEPIIEHHQASRRLKNEVPDAAESTPSDRRGD